MSSQVRAPRFSLSVEGNSLTVLEMEILISWEQHASYCSATLPLYSSPGAAYWASLGNVSCTVHGQNDTGTSYTLFIGNAEQIQLDFTAGTVRVEGRGNTAKLIDKKVTKKYTDQTAADIIQDVASLAGMSAQTDSFSDKVGKIHTQQYAHLTDMQTAWDVIAYLAQREGKVPFVKDSTVYFKDAGQSAASSGASGGTITAQFTPPTSGSPASGNVLTLQCLRNGLLSGSSQVKVTSYHTRKDKVIAVTKSWGGSGSATGENTDTGSTPSVGGTSAGGGDGSSSSARTYEFRFPNLTDDQANTIAGALTSQISANEIDVTCEMPGDVTTVDAAEIAVSGTGTSLDQTYAILTSTHRFDWDNGYTMSINARKIGTQGS